MGIGLRWAVKDADRAVRLVAMCLTVPAVTSVKPLEMLSFAAGLEAAHPPVARRCWFACEKRGYFDRFQGF